MLNCIDADGSKKGFELNLITAVRRAVSIPVIASSGAGEPGHFTNCFIETRTEAALAAGMFHRNEYTIRQVKEEMENHYLPTTL